MEIRIILSELFLSKWIWCMVHLSYFDLRWIILRWKHRLCLCPWWSSSIPRSDFRQKKSMAKRKAVFASWWRYDFYVVECVHQHWSGGPLHLEGSRSSIMIIVPFLQTGQVLISMPQILSNWSCQVSDFSFSVVTVVQLPMSSRHRAILSLRLLFAKSPKCLMRTYRWGNIWRRNLLMNSSALRVIVFCLSPSA